MLLGYICRLIFNTYMTTTRPNLPTQTCRGLAEGAKLQGRVGPKDAESSTQQGDRARQQGWHHARRQSYDREHRRVWGHIRRQDGHARGQGRRHARRQGRPLRYGVSGEHENIDVENIDLFSCCVVIKTSWVLIIRMTWAGFSCRDVIKTCCVLMDCMNQV